MKKKAKAREKEPAALEKLVTDETPPKPKTGLRKEDVERHTPERRLQGS